MTLDFVRRGGDAPTRDAPESTLSRGRREWDDRYASLARGRRNWQLAALGLLAIDGLLSAGLVRLAGQSRITPYVVEVDRVGQAVAFGPAEQLRRTDERLIRYELALFVRDVRSVFSDAEAQRSIVHRAYSHAKGEALGFLNEHFREANPFLRASSGTVAVEVHSVLRLSAASWQVQWEESALAADGRITGRTSWQAVLAVEVTPPDTTDALLVNPLGLYVTEIHWTQSL
jgi:type IV secretory pathway TrbF-like protein